MKRLLDLRALAAGTFVAAMSTAASFGLAIIGFGNVYYASVFMPLAMLLCLAVAWFMFLRADGFARPFRTHDPAPGPHPAEPIRIPGIGGKNHDSMVQPQNVSVDGNLPGGLPSSLYAPLDGAIVEQKAGTSGRTALLWAALELGALAAILYSVAGLGTQYYR